MWGIIGVIALLIVISLLYAHFSSNLPTLHQENQKVKETLDSNRIWVQQWQQQRTADSVQAAQQIAHMNHIDAQVQKIPQMIQRINTRTDAQIHNITLLSTDQQLTLFTNWISEIDSL